jgi:hypothetical protein
MLTLAKIQTYESFGGDIDGFARSRGGHDGACITDADWSLIDELRQGLYLVASQMASARFAVELEQRLHAVTMDDGTRDALRRLALT